MKSWEKVAICKNWCDCLVYPTVMNSHVTLTINAWRTKTTVGLKAFQLLKFQREDCLRSSSSARIGGKPSLYKGRDGKGWIPLVWLLGYNESLSDSMGSWILDWYVWTMTKQSLSQQLRCWYCHGVFLCILWLSEVTLLENIHEWTSLFVWWQIGCHTFKT